MNLHFQFPTVSHLELSLLASGDVRTCLGNVLMFTVAYLFLIDGKQNWLVVLGHVARSEDHNFKIQQRWLLTENYTPQHKMKLPMSY